MPVDFDPAFKEELLRIQRKLDSITGPGVRHTRDRIYVGWPTIPTPRRQRPAEPATFLVSVEGAEAGAGKYHGYVTTGSSSPLSVETDLADTDLYAGPGGAEQIVIFNTLERGIPGHWLTDGGGIPQRPILAWWHPGGAMTNETQPRRIALIADMGYERDCDEEEEA